MKKHIYKITNNINGKIYIGQSKSPNIRFSAHEKRKSGSKSLQEDIKKYGIENFSHEILEYTEDYSNRERYWISYYNSNKTGYNKSKGGEEPPVRYGEDNFFTKYSKEIVLEIKKLLLQGELTSREISKLLGVGESAVNRINNGYTWYEDGCEYPLRRDITKMQDNIYDEILDLLINSNLTQKQIAEKFNIARTTVTAINRGQNFRKDYIDYPIRKKGVEPDYVQGIIHDLSTFKGENVVKRIAEKYGFHETSIYAINAGRTYRKDFLTYPIYKYKK